jgi:ribonucleotide monophosphatase NagD (HAD superfamily)
VKLNYKLALTKLQRTEEASEGTRNVLTFADRKYQKGTSERNYTDNIDEVLCRIELNNFLFSQEDFLAADTYLFSITGVTIGCPLSQRTVASLNKLMEMKKRVVFLSEDSQSSRKAVAKSLIQQGINLDVNTAHNSVVNAAFTCAWFLKQAGLTKPFVICSSLGLIEELKLLGIKEYVATVDGQGRPKKEYLEPATLTNVTALVKKVKDVDSIVFGWDMQVTPLKLTVAECLIRWAAEPTVRSVSQVSSNGWNRQISPDSNVSSGGSQRVVIVSCSSEASGMLGVTPIDYCREQNFNGRQVLTMGNGRSTDIIKGAATEKNLPIIDVGKPSDLMLEALQHPTSDGGLSVDLRKAVMIGDSLQTDVEMAHLGGIRSLMVFSGQTSPEEFVKQLSEKDDLHMPTWVLNSLADIDLDIDR